MSGLLKKIFSNAGRELVDSVGGVIDNLTTNNEEKQTAKEQLTNLVLTQLNRLNELQTEAITTEMSGNWLQRSWRPIIMLSFGFVIVYTKFISQAFGLPSADLEGDFWGLLEIGLGGYVIGRSVEKVTDKVTKNVDLSFLRKKDRKDIIN